MNQENPPITRPCLLLHLSPSPAFSAGAANLFFTNAILPSIPGFSTKRSGARGSRSGVETARTGPYRSGGILGGKVEGEGGNAVTQRVELHVLCCAVLYGVGVMRVQLQSQHRSFRASGGKGKLAHGSVGNGISERCW